MNVNSNLQYLFTGGKPLKQEFLTSESYRIKYSEYRRQWYLNPMYYFVSKFPLFLDLDISSACNLKCPTCVQTINKPESHLMSSTIFTKIIDEAVEKGCYGFKCHTIGRGEPLLHPDIVDYISYGKDKGLIDIRLNTNGTLLDFDLICGLLKAKLDMIIFSVDGLGKEYNRSRPGVDFQELVDKINMFIKVRNIGKYQTVIRVQTIDFVYIDMEEYTDFWIKKGADQVTAISYKNMKSREFGIKGDWVCAQPWQRLSVLYDGTVLPCNHDDRLISKLGNVLDDTLENMWNGTHINTIRFCQKDKQADSLGACDGCFLRTAEIKKGGA